MKSKDSVPTQAVIDAWMASVEAEFGVGWHTTTLSRLASTVRDLIESPTHLSSCIVEFGYRNGTSNHTLDFTVRCLELLTAVCDAPLAARLNTRNVAVLVAEGWNAGALGRIPPTDDLLTPMPVFLHLLKQRYVGAGTKTDRISQRVVLVVADLGDVIASQAEFEQLRAGAIDGLRSVWSAGQPISEGANGNLVVMVERNGELHAMVGQLRRLILADAALSANRIRAWIEPLSDAEFHLVSHLESLVGKIESPPEMLRRAV